MNILRSSILFILLATALGYTQFSTTPKVATTSFQFLKVTTSARPAALSGICATSVHNANAVFFNPSNLVYVSGLDMSVSYLDYFMDVTISSIALAYKYKEIGSFAAFAVINDMGEIEYTNAENVYMDYESGLFNPGITGETYNISSQVFGISFARQITNKFSFGLTVKYVREDLWRESASAIVFDGGINYQTGYKSLDLGVMLQHFGKDITFVNRSYPLPQSLTLGISAIMIGSNAPFVMSSSSYDLLALYHISQTRDHSQQHHLGMELSLIDLIDLRAGYKINFDEENLTFGVGLKTHSFRFDYAFNNFGEYLDPIHNFSMGYSLK